MDIVIYTQYYRTNNADRQRELDECLRRNTNHPGISRVMLFVESDAPPLPKATVPVEVIESDERMTYAEWFRWVRRQEHGIALLLNSDIYIDEGLEHLTATFDRPDIFMALTRYNPAARGLHLNDFPHWTQDVWGIRADSDLPESLIYASAFPLGFPGCDNRIAYVLWSHGFRVRNPCYHVRTIHLQASTARNYNKNSDRLYGGVSYVHPSLAPEEDAELEFTLWTRSMERPAGVLINQLSAEKGVHQLHHGDQDVAQRFFDQQQFTGMSWQHVAVGSAHLQGDIHRFTSEDTVFLPMALLLDQGVELQFQRPTKLEALTLRLPRRSLPGHQLLLRAEGDAQSRLVLEGDSALAVGSCGERIFWQSEELRGGQWSCLRLRLLGPIAEPAWRVDEGAELVLFGEEGSLTHIKSINLIAVDLPDEPTERAPTEEVNGQHNTRLLQSVRFAERALNEGNSLNNVIVKLDQSTSFDATHVADLIAGSNKDFCLKYLVNTCLVSEAGTYSASVCLKSGTQTLVVLRINDDTGLNDAQQVYDLNTGRKKGSAINSGSASGACSTIESIGNGWYRCSISCTFNESMAFINAPSVWLQHYGPTDSTGTVYSRDAQVEQIYYSSMPVGAASGYDVSKRRSQAPKSSILQKGLDSQNSKVGQMGSVDVYTSKMPEYSWRRRIDCHNQLEISQELYQFGNRFRVLLSEQELLFEDRFWPSVGAIKLTSFPFGINDKRALLLWGFCQPVLELRSGFIASKKRFPADVNFWQYPCLTEGDAFSVHTRLVGPQIIDGVLHIYIGLPWATWIDCKFWPPSILGAFRRRIEALRIVLDEFSIKLTVHSVCQHIDWRSNVLMFKSAGIDSIALSHRPLDENSLEGMRLGAWHLYPVNARDPDRSSGLAVKEPRLRKYLASFIGAHMDHYISSVRRELKQYHNSEGFLVELNDDWHFSSEVYDQQVKADYISSGSTRPSTASQKATLRYNQVLSDSVFSLCPAGAGPNSIRLWESMAVGSIPVILSDSLVLPAIPDEESSGNPAWEDAVLRHPENDLISLPTRLRSLSWEEVENRSAACIKISDLFQRRTCFSCFAKAPNETPPRPARVPVSKTSNESAISKYDSRNQLEVLSSFKHQQIQDVGNTHASFTGRLRRSNLVISVSNGHKESTRVIHFDQAELVKEVQISISGKAELCIRIDNATDYNQFEQLCQATFVQAEATEKPLHSIMLTDKEGIWSECLRITVVSLETIDNITDITASFNFVVVKDAYSKAVKRLDESGVLKFASESSSARQDDLLLTVNIDNANVLKALSELQETGQPFPPNKLLFPEIPIPTRNLIDEDIGDGITMYVHLMNRNENIMKNLSNWLSLSFDELILLDWSTEGGITHLPGIYDDPRIRIVRVEGQTSFIRTIAQNVASRMSRNRRIFKCDSDVEFKGDFFAAHPLQKSTFWVGEWKQARDFNERHLHGETYYWLDDFLRVGGYDERIKGYGHDDSNFKDRLLLAGVRKRVFSYEFMHHQEHEQTVRAQGSHGIHPMVATYANRLMACYNPLWSASSDLAKLRLLDLASDRRYVRFSLESQCDNQTNQRCLDEALMIVGSWYISSENIKLMSKEEINEVIWKRQIE